MTGKLTPTEVIAYFDADPMPCLICGRKYQLLGRHITMWHDMLVREYCEEFGIPFEWKGHTGLATMAQRQRMSDCIPEDHREFVRSLHELAHPPTTKKWNAAWKVVRHALSAVADRECRHCGKTFTPSRADNSGWCSRQCASRRPNQERPWTVKAPSPCANCGKIYKPLRRGRCNRCRLYFSKYDAERPINEAP
jgi:hypothetical protein